MKIVLSGAQDQTVWLEAFSRALPEARIEPWSAAFAIEADYALVWKPAPHVLPSLGRAKAVFNLGAGVDAIPDLACVPREAVLVRLDDAGMAEQMIEYVCHAVLRCYRQFDDYAAQQRQAIWRPLPRIAKSEFVIGVLGAGVLGSAVANALAQLNFPVRVWSRSRKPMGEIASFAGADELPGFLAATHVLVCLLPLTRDTRHLLDRTRLSLLPEGAHLVNVARGALLVDTDLLEMLDAGRLASAVLDVFEDEPLPQEHPFWHHRRVTLTPHVSAVTLVRNSAEQIAGKIRRLEAGLPITGVVDRDRGY